MNLQKTLAEYRLGLFAATKLPMIAIDALEAGEDSPSLRQLAGDDGKDSEVVTRLFEKALREIGIQLPSAEQAALSVASNIANEVLAGTLDPYEGARMIWSRLYVHQPNIQRLQVFVGLASECEDDPQNKPEYLKEIIKECRLLIAEVGWSGVSLADKTYLVNGPG